MRQWPRPASTSALQARTYGGRTLGSPGSSLTPLRPRYRACHVPAVPQRPSHRLAAYHPASIPGARSSQVSDLQPLQHRSVGNPQAHGHLGWRVPAALYASYRQPILRLRSHGHRTIIAARSRAILWIGACSYDAYRGLNPRCLRYSARLCSPRYLFSRLHTSRLSASHITCLCGSARRHSGHMHTERNLRSLERVAGFLRGMGPISRGTGD
jgi:hypothetical protein